MAKDKDFRNVGQADKGHSQDHKVINLGLILKSFSRHTKYDVSVSYVSKVMAKVKLFLDKDRQVKN